MLRCALHQNCIPHYRRQLFELLCGVDDVQITIASYTKPDSPNIEVVDSNTSALRWIFCPTRMLMGSHFMWHPTFMAYIRREKPDAVISMGNPYVITSWLLLLWGRFADVPVLLWTHGLLGSEVGL